MSILSTAVIGLSLIGLASSTAPGAGVATASAVGEPAAAPSGGGTLRVALSAESSGFNPHVDPWENSGHLVALAVFDPLLVYDADGVPRPNLAASIEPNADSTVWTITVREGITFHNGEHLDAAALKRNFDAFRAGPSASIWGSVESVDVVDDRTVRVTMSAPWGSFPNTLVGGAAGVAGYVAAPAMLDDPDGGRHPIGTGPFVFDEWIPDDHLTVVRNDDYWQTPAYLDRIEFRPIADYNSTLAAFDSGDVDVMITANARDSREFLDRSAAGEATVVSSDPSEPDVLALNTARPPLDDIRVRRALAMAIDTDRIIELVGGTGVKEAMRGPYAEGSFWHVETDYPRYDPDEARELIDEYEADIGPVEFEFAGSQDPASITYMELIQSMWSDVGADAAIESRAAAELIESTLSGEFDVVTWGNTGGADPDDDYASFHSGELNVTGYHTDEIDAAMEHGRALADPEARREQYAIVQRALGDAVPYIWLASNQWIAVGRAGVHGLGEAWLADGSPARALTGSRLSFVRTWLSD